MKRHVRPHPARPARLFAEPDRAADPAPDAYTAHIDGAARGNPGPAAYGVVLRRPDGRPLGEFKKYVGRTTNNVAEYYALIAALDYARAHGIRKLRVRSDSELLVRQMQGRYKVKSPDLRPLHERARRLSQGLAHFSIEHVPREQNREADRLANEALDRTGTSPANVAAPTLSGAASSAKAASADLKVAATRTRQEGEIRTIRARYSKGVLHPAEPLNLPEGEEVEITIYPPRRG